MHRPATRRHNPIIAELSGRYRTGTQYFVATQNESSRRLSAPQDGNAYAELQQLRLNHEGVVDVHVVLCARQRHHAIVTSDPRDIARVDPTVPRILV
jgi:hypothetical protein